MSARALQRTQTNAQVSAETLMMLLCNQDSSPLQQPTPSHASLSPSRLSESKVVQPQSVSVRYRTDFLQFYQYYFKRAMGNFIPRFSHGYLGMAK